MVDVCSPIQVSEARGSNEPSYSGQPGQHSTIPAPNPKPKFKKQDLINSSLMISVTTETWPTNRLLQFSLWVDCRHSIAWSQPGYSGIPVLSSQVRLHTYTKMEYDVPKLFKLDAFSNNWKNYNAEFNPILYKLSTSRKLFL